MSKHRTVALTLSLLITKENPLSRPNPLIIIVKMLELRLMQGSLLKKVLESIKELVNDANFNCSSIGFSLQGNDDIITIKADNGSNTVTFMFEIPSMFPLSSAFFSILEFISNFDVSGFSFHM